MQKEKIIAVLVLICLINLNFTSCKNQQKKVKFLFTGDLMLDRGVRKEIASKGMNDLFSDVKLLFQNHDFCVANFECVTCDETLLKSDKKFTFRANPEWISGMKNNGISCLTIANNHSFDFGEKGLQQMIAHLKQNDIKPIGCRGSINENYEPLLFEKDGSNIALFSVTFLKQDNNLICNDTPKELAKRIQLFKTKHPSYLIFVCLHWGVEMKSKPTSLQIKQAHYLINNGVDIIIGHHPHIVQTIEKYKGKYIFYSIGNFIFDNNHTPANQAILTSFTLSKSKIQSLQIIPINIVNSKPKMMSLKESVKFMHYIDSISEGINVKMNQNNWEIF